MAMARGSSVPCPKPTATTWPGGAWGLATQGGSGGMAQEERANNSNPLMNGFSVLLMETSFGQESNASFSKKRVTEPEKKW